jgi:hypothetical protein
VGPRAGERIGPLWRGVTNPRARRDGLTCFGGALRSEWGPPPWPTPPIAGRAAPVASVLVCAGPARAFRYRALRKRNTWSVSHVEAFANFL